MADKSEFNTSHVFRGSVPDVSKVVMMSTAGYRVVEEKKVTLGKQAAEKVLCLTEVPGDRGLIDGHVEYIMTQMVRGTFLYENHIIASAVCAEDNKEYRINAQHTCWAAWLLADKGIDVQHGKSRYLKYAADTLADVRQLYSLYDRLKSRSKANVVVANLFDTVAFADVGRDMLKRLSAAFGFWMWPHSSERSRHDANEVGHLIQHVRPALCLAVLAFIKTQNGLSTPEKMPFRRAAVMGAMLETFSAVPQKAVDFWAPVCSGLGLDSSTDPRHKLRLALQGSNVVSGYVSNKKAVEAETMYRWCIFAWNAWRRGDPVQQLRAPLNTPRPKATTKLGKQVTDDPS